MVTIKELDDAKKTTDDAFNEYCRNGNTTTAEDFYLINIGMGLDTE